MANSTNNVPPFPYPDQPATATLTDTTNGNVYAFPFNINSLNWNYQMNTQSYSTMGGRVTQMLSVQITTMTIQGDAGSRKAIIDLYNAFRSMQDNQNASKVSMKFDVPSRNLSFQVWLENFQLGWGVQTVAYEYSMQFEVDQDVSGIAINASTTDALNHVVNNNGGNIGFSAAWTGLSSSVQNYQFVDIQNAINSGALVPANNQKS
jgi:hypothetical protein